MKHLIFIGPLGGGSMPTNGASIKNCYLLNVLRRYYKSITVIDTEHWKKKPWLIIKILINILCHANSVYVLSASNMSAFRFLHFFSKLPFYREIYYWVIGGSLADLILQGMIDSKPYYCVKKIIVEGVSMRAKLLQYGFTNVYRIPNFKTISYLPKKNTKYSSPRKFVFLSRILPEKGCDYIIEAVQILNQKYKDLYFVDFYGPIAPNYKKVFFSKIENISNLTYKGFLDLRCYENYNILSVYDVMLFPTYWHGEGFPGIVIDAYIAGLPIIATDWNMNKDVVQNEFTGLLISPHNVSALVNAMYRFIVMEQRELLLFSKHCCQKAKTYDINNVLSEDILNEIGLITTNLNTQDI